VYKSSFLSDIQKINKLAKESNPDAIVDFEVYLESIKDIGSFSSTTWPINFRKEIYEFGKVFTDVQVGPFLEKIEEFKSKNVDNSEIYDFIYSEIIWNFFEQNNSYIKKEFNSLIKKYPTNPEFHHSYSHFLEQNNNFEQALFEVKTAIKIEPGNNIFTNTYIYKIKSYFDHLILKGKIGDAEKLLEIQEKEATKIKVLNKFNEWNIFSSLKDRLKDHKSMQERVRFFEKEIENRIQIEQRKVIEILGIFSAILGFILTSISLAIKSLSLQEMLILMLGMSLVLLLFSISISYLFGKNYRYAGFFYFLKHPKFYAGVLIFLSLVGLIFFIG
jgi:tetratricopeptide (TPR) repeat protein